MTKPKPRFGGPAGCVGVAARVEALLVEGLGARWRQNFFGPRVQQFCENGGSINIHTSSYDTRVETLEIYMSIEGAPAGDMRLRPAGGSVEFRLGRAPMALDEIDDEALDELITDCDVCQYCEGPLASPVPLSGRMFKVAWVKVPPQFRMNGHGLVMYELAWYLVSALGCYLCSDSERSGFAERVWSGFVRKGFAMPVASDYTGVLYAAPHEQLYVTADDVSRGRTLLVRGADEALDLIAVLEADIDQLEEERRADDITDDVDDELEERIDALVEEVSRVWWSLLEPHNERVHEMNRSLTFPPIEEDGDYITIPPGGAVDITDGQTWWPHEPLEVGLSWPCYRYALNPVQHTTAAARGMFGLGRTLDMPTLPDDDAADFG